MTDNAIVPANSEPGGEFLFYQTEDGGTRVQVRMDEETVWITQKQMTDLFQKDVRTVSEHIRNIFDEGELAESATIRNFRIVQTEGARQVERYIDHYNLDVIISVGYCVKSHRGTQFRIWATQRLREYLIKGFTMDDERLKQRGGGNYFDELLARIRDIRSSEKVFGARYWRSTPPASIMTPRSKHRSSSSKRCKTRCTGRRTATPPPRSSPNAPMPRNRAWG